MGQLNKIETGYNNGSYPIAHKDQTNQQPSSITTNQRHRATVYTQTVANNSSQQITQYVHVGVPNYYLQTGDIESQFVDIFYQRWTRLFLHDVVELNGWEWEIDQSYVKPSETREILIYPRVLGTISAKVRRENQCGKGPWLTEYFEVIEEGGFKILKQ